MLLFFSYSFGIETTYTFTWFPRKPYPNSDQNRLSLYPFSEQNGVKPVPFGAAHTYKANIREYCPPSPPPPHGYRTKYSSSSHPKFSITYRFVTFCAEPQVPSRLGVGLQNKNKKELRLSLSLRTVQHRNKLDF